MAALNFPASPTVGQQYTANGSTWQWNGTVWSAYNTVFSPNGMVLNGQTITANYTMPSGDNGMTAGPITVNSGVSVTVPTGAVWTVV
jgi:hypothetical protein